MSIEAGEDDHRLLDFFFDRGRDSGFAISRISSVSQNDLFGEPTSRIKADSKHDALLFIHGYNTSFPRSVSPAVGPHKLPTTSSSQVLFCFMAGPLTPLSHRMQAMKKWQNGVVRTLRNFSSRF
jgi:hypothetical protein